MEITEIHKNLHHIANFLIFKLRSYSLIACPCSVAMVLHAELEEALSKSSCLSSCWDSGLDTLGHLGPHFQIFAKVKRYEIVQIPTSISLKAQAAYGWLSKCWFLDWALIPHFHWGPLHKYLVGSPNLHFIKIHQQLTFVWEAQ